MNQPNAFLIRRKALARFRKRIPFLGLIPPSIYQQLSPLAWYEPYGQIEKMRQGLEKTLDCYVMVYKRYGPDIPWEAQLLGICLRWDSCSMTAGTQKCTACPSLAAAALEA